MRVVMVGLYLGFLVFGCLACTASNIKSLPISSHSIVYRAKAHIKAPPETIWKIILQFERYAKWNPWLFWAKGSPKQGEVVWAKVILGKEKRDAKHIVMEVEPYTRFCWRDAGWTTIFVYGQRCRYLKKRPDGTTELRQELMIQGAFSGTAKRKYGVALQKGLNDETAALKKRAEQFHASFIKKQKNKPKQNPPSK